MVVGLREGPCTIWLLGLITIGLVFGFFLSPSPSRAEEGEEIEEIVVREVRIRAALDDPSSTVTVIEVEDLGSGLETTPEILARVPGLKVRQYGGLGQLSTVMIRGSSAEQVLVLVDGVRLNTGQGGGVDISSIPVDTIERIEVIRGGGTAIYGHDAIGGVVNIVTRSPEAGENAIQEVSLAGGSYGSLKAHYGINGSTGPGAALFSFTHFQSRGDFPYFILEEYLNGLPLRSAEESRRVNNDFLSEDALLKSTWPLSEKTELTFSSNLFHTVRGQAGFGDDQRERARQKVFRSTNSVRIEKEDIFVDDSRGGFGISYLYSSIGFQDPEPAIGEPIDTGNASSTIEGLADFERSAETEQVSHYFRLSIQARHEYLRERTVSDTAGFGDQGRAAQSLAMQHECVLLEGTLSFVPVFRFAYTEGFGVRMTPKLGLVWQPKGLLTVRANLESSYRPPSLNELYYPDQGFMRGNPNLDPEEALNWDAGVSIKRRRWLAEAVYFGRRVDESIVWLPVSAFTVMPENTGRVDVAGVEAIVEMKPWSFIEASANYTFLKAIDMDTGEQLAGNPLHSAFGSFIFRRRPLLLRVEAQYTGEISATTTGTRIVGEWVRTDLALELDLLSLLPRLKKRGLDRGKLTFECKNAGNVFFADARTFPLPGRTFFGTLALTF